MLRALVLFPLLATVACSSWNTGEPNAGDAERACNDTVKALAEASARCGEEYARVHDAQLIDIAGGDCKNITNVRDEPSLRSECLPSLATAPCPDILSNTHDPSCAAQLERRY